jgi:flagellin-specific chaperone FliS
MKLSGELDYRIRYDVEHDLFHAQNVFNDEYITPTFVEYVQKLEKENAELKAVIDNDVDKKIYVQLARLADMQKKQLTKATELIEDILDKIPASHSDYYKDVMERAKQFVNEVEVKEK